MTYQSADDDYDDPFDDPEQDAFLEDEALAEADAAGIDRFSGTRLMLVVAGIACCIVAWLVVTNGVQILLGEFNTTESGQVFRLSDLLGALAVVAVAIYTYRLHQRFVVREI